MGKWAGLRGGKSKKGMRVQEAGEQQEGWKYVDGFERRFGGGIINRHDWQLLACGGRRGWLPAVPPRHPEQARGSWDRLASRSLRPLVETGLGP